MADNTVIACPGCKKKFRGKGDLRGKKIRCPFCAKPFQVPGGVEETAVTLPPKAGKAVPKAAATPPPKAPEPAPPPPDDDDENDNPYRITTEDLTPRCPNCANEMESETAVICLYCGYNTQTRTWGQTEKVYELSGSEHFKHLLPGLLCVLVIILQIAWVIYYCLVLPFNAKDTWYKFSDHESMRLWTAIIILFDLWPLGIFAFHRLVLKPKPKERAKE